MSQATANILMVRPVRFGFNEQTAESNAFQEATSQEFVQTKALHEFDTMVAGLRKEGVNVLVFEDTPEPFTPDSVFPNNWVSFHENGEVILYPMQAPNRRQERRMDIIENLKDRFSIEKIVDLSYFETENKFLEGTGSMVLDRIHKIAYACLSPRTNAMVLERFGKETGYEIISFEAVDAAQKAIYHTNVLMCIGNEFVVICLEAIANVSERNRVVERLEATAKTIVEISEQQMNCFAGNMLLVTNHRQEKLLVMSTSSFESLTTKQRDLLANYAKVLHFDLTTIEKNGGGSARCMLAEVYLQEK